MLFATTLALPAFDLSNVVAQIRADPLYADWSKEKLHEAEVEYRRYLALCKAYPTTPLNPTQIADVVWHRHILNTRQYIDDCQAFFGKYLHHRPGKSPTAEVRVSRDLYRQHFGAPSGFKAGSGAATCDDMCNDVTTCDDMCNDCPREPREVRVPFTC